jgi:ElaB/YqjD/DUF883 family membrane-anchored ribosome-binding protein
MANTDRLYRTASDSLEDIKARAHEAIDKLTDASHQTAGLLNKKGQQLMKVEERMLKNSRECIRERPLASVAIALAIGMVLSRLLSTR